MVGNTTQSSQFLRGGQVLAVVVVSLLSSDALVDWRDLDLVQVLDVPLRIARPDGEGRVVLVASILWNSE